MKVRDGLGFLVAAAIPAVTGALTPISGGVINTDLVSIFGLFVVFYLVSFAFMVMLGLPALLLLRKYNLVRWWSAVLAGFLAGSIISIALSPPPNALIENILFMAVVGAASGLACWLIVRPSAAA